MFVSWEFAADTSLTYKFVNSFLIYVITALGNRLNPPVVTETGHVPDGLCCLWGKVKSSSHRFGHSANQTFTQSWEEATDSALRLHPLHCGGDDTCHASNDTWERGSLFKKDKQTCRDGNLKRIERLGSLRCQLLMHDICKQWCFWDYTAEGCSNINAVKNVAVLEHLINPWALTQLGHSYLLLLEINRMHWIPLRSISCMFTILQLVVLHMDCTLISTDWNKLVCFYLLYISSLG